ncbi:sirohydrochlorin chelatase [Nocardia callitridis]|uniref:Sirohydrochlorin chelatase n=1 Tax=Nocardia callitridis TaxID=648753 RepID=A0ABP9JSM2_9NOCA
MALIARLAEAVTGELAASSPGGARTPCVRTAFVDVLGPSPAEVLRDLAERGSEAVAVPAFLASGYHVYHDVPRAVAESGHPGVVVTPAMGPDPALARVQHLRLVAVGWRPGDEVVFAAAGSSDARARADVRRAAGLLGARLGVEPTVGYIATGAPTVGDSVAALRVSGGKRVFVASYLLSHGLFQQRLSEAEADGVAAPIGVHRSVVGLIAERYRSAVHELDRTHAR